MDTATRDQIIKRGANARALGQSEFDCPFFAATETPRATGESIEEWTAKVEAWNLGFMLEDAVRG